MIGSYFFDLSNLDYGLVTNYNTKKNLKFKVTRAPQLRAIVFC